MEESLLEPEHIAKTPMMEQWLACKKKSNGAILFFRMGDFYELFYDDATIISNELDIAITQRCGVPMSGVPHYTCDIYVDKLVAKGYKIAIAEQLSSPKAGKGIVKRDIAKFITPGTLISSSLISDRFNNYIACVNQIGSIYGLVIIEMTTGSFKAAEFDNSKSLMNELHKLSPAEIIASIKFIKKNIWLSSIKEQLNIVISSQDEWRFDSKIAHSYLLQHFNVSSLDGFGVKGMESAITSGGALLSYLKEELLLPVNHIRSLSPYNSNEFMSIDGTSRATLEIYETNRDKKKQFSLIYTIDLTISPMGNRLIKDRINNPSLSVETINKRLDQIEYFLYAKDTRNITRHYLKGIKDIERLITKIETGYASPRDLVSLKTSLQFSISIKSEVLIDPSLSTFSMPNVNEVINIIDAAIEEEPPIRLSDGSVFKTGYNLQLDDLKSIMQNGKQWLIEYQTKLQQQLNIKKLKIGFNKIFGYYIEVPTQQSNLMPEEFIRRQTKINSERFISQELKNFENKISNAESLISDLENNLFRSICTQIALFHKEIKITANIISEIDVATALAELAFLNKYTRPTVDNSRILNIKEGKHPIVDKLLSNDGCMPNSIYLDGENTRMMLITGPNMAGKSTYIRQQAIIVIMAQMGSFVPAASAHIGIIDNIFTRIGAGDDLSRGQSTFMIEMTETATILNNATDRSLVILDEIGRGTGTYDGLSIAWAVSEHLIVTQNQQAKILFATHYRELTALEELFPAVINFHASVKEQNGAISFLYRIIEGIAEKSYGIHVAKLAGFPISVIIRAQAILGTLEQDKNKQSKALLKKESEKGSQLSFF